MSRLTRRLRRRRPQLPQFPPRLARIVAMMPPPIPRTLPDGRVDVVFRFPPGTSLEDQEAIVGAFSAVVQQEYPKAAPQTYACNCPDCLTDLPNG